MVELIERNMLPNESLMGVLRSRIIGEYQGQVTWLLTIHPELDPRGSPASTYHQLTRDTLKVSH